MSTEHSHVTASMLYNYVKCEHRPWMDLYGDPALRDDASPFVQLLWRRGRAHEDAEIGKLAGTHIAFADAAPAEREERTVEAMDRGDALIFGGRISHGNLVGEPDILRRESGRYVPGDVKSGAADEGPSSADRKPKLHYAVQLALYVDVLEGLGRSAGRYAFVLDAHGKEVRYDFTAAKGARTTATLWDDYEEAVAAVRAILAGTADSTPALSAECKGCWWYRACLAELIRSDDLTLLPDLGRSRRTPLLPYVTTVAQLAASPPGWFLDDKGKSIVKGLSADGIAKYRDRAIVRATNGTPYLKAPLDTMPYGTELFFDVETDSMRDRCYLHGFVVRTDRNDATEHYVSFFSDEATAASERDAFARAWSFAHSKWPCAVYIYSKAERTWWRELQRRYPDVCSTAEVEEFFGPATMTDLYAVVQNQSEWPTMDYSLKTLAKYLGFAWEDAHPSGSASIEWYDRYVGGEPDAKQRILVYNEDDCRAMRVLIDAMRKLPVNETPA